MQRGALAVMIGMSCVALAVFAACTGDDPDLDGATPDSGSGADTSVTSTNDSSTGDGAISCPNDTADCDGDPTSGCETNIKTSPAHCGRCAFACGGAATCTNGQCDVEKIRDGLDHPFSFEIAGGRLLWFAGNGTFVDGCRIDDCASSTARMAEITRSSSNVSLTNDVDRGPRLMVVDGNFFFVPECNTASSACFLAKCPITGCKLEGLTPVNGDVYGLRNPYEVVSAPGAVFFWNSQDGFTRHDTADGGIAFRSREYGMVEYVRGIYVDAQRVIYVDDNPSIPNPTGGIYTCPVSGCQGARTPLIGPAVRLLAVGGGRAITATYGANAGLGSVLACDYVNGCSLTGDVLATNQAYVRDLAAADNAVYWVTSGNPDPKTGAAATGTVMRCALPKCAGGPTKIADAQANPVRVRIDADYVYWMNFGTPSQANGSIHRRRR